jgi:ParB family transcriptional regulator, chromosome partitioning protein
MAIQSGRTVLASIDDIDIGNRIRTLNEQTVVGLMDSMSELGLLNPITVYQLPENDAAAGPRFGLVAGAHRLEACRRLGMSNVAARVVAMTSWQRQLAECDENLRGTNLGHAERALLTARRKEAYEALHPETRQGGAGNGRAKGRQIGNSTRFTADTAAQTGRSERGVQRAAEQGRKIDNSILKRIVGTDLDKGIVLAELARTPREEQAAKVAQIVRRIELPKPQRGRSIATGNPDSAGEAAPIKRGSSRAAKWIVQKLGRGSAAHLADMLTGEDLVTFLAELGDLSRSSDLTAADESTDPADGFQVEPTSSGHPTADCLAPNTVGAGAPLIAESEPAAARPIIASELDAQRAPTRVETFTLASMPMTVNSHSDPSTQVREACGDHQRPSNWHDVADEPEPGAHCRECRGANWWADPLRHQGWRCVGCFLPKDSSGTARFVSTSR